MIHASSRNAIADQAVDGGEVARGLVTEIDGHKADVGDRDAGEITLLVGQMLYLTDQNPDADIHWIQNSIAKQLKDEALTDFAWSVFTGVREQKTDIDDQIVAVDPLAISDLSSWWEIMADDETTVLVHGGQAEIRFCLTLHEKPPQKLIDVQLAEGLRSRSYPLSYANLVRRVLNRTTRGKETRTDWRRRPLSKQQIDYALEDVRHVPEIWARQNQSLTKRGRLDWAHAEFQRMITEIEKDLAAPPWKRLPGLHRLSSRDLAVAHQLARWREEEAVQRNCQPRRVLRDDLLVDLARRQPANARELTATRDMNRSQYKRGIEGMLAAIREAQEIPDDDLPRPPREDRRSEKNHDEEVLGKLLALALSNRCAELNISMQLLGTSSDLRQLVRTHMEGNSSDSVVKLMHGWRAEVCGNLLIDVLEGRISFRVAPPSSSAPLIFERHE